MSDPMAEIRASFFIECEELLEALQDGLTEMDGGSTDAETINVCFRAVHSIKGGAGAFGLNQLVRFAHRYETVMDEIRSGRLAPDRDAMVLFFRAADILSDILRASRDGEEFDTAETETVLSELEGLAGATTEEQEEAEVDDFQPMTLSLDFGPPSGVSEGEGWTITFRPHKALFASGNEPQHLLRALARLGPTSTSCDISSIPTLPDFDTDEAYLQWTIKLDSPSTESEIREIFDFVDGICDLDIEGCGSMAPPLLPLLDSLPQTIDDNETVATEPEISSHRLTLSEPSAQAASTTYQNAILENEKSGPLPTSSPTTDPEVGDVTCTKLGAQQSTPSASEKAEVIRDASPRTSQPVQQKATVRVDLERIDRLVNLVGELVINQAMLSQSVQEANIPSNSPVSQGLEEFMQLTRDIQDSVMMIRAQPVKSLFQRMSRIVRESSSAVGKRVRLVTQGESTEVDKTVIERLADPLTHMIRNAVDHGLESSESRIANGKPEEGIVTLKAMHRSGRIIIDVSDDGAGIDRPKVQEIAISKGLIPEAVILSDGEIDNLLFMAGFSTAPEISDLSGRGVGMDVVRSSIQELGGRISISSEPGMGTTFSISLPLTLAVLDGMVVRSGGETLVVPLGSIVETLSLQDDAVRTIGPGAKVLYIRNTFVPMIDLATCFGYREPLDNYLGCVVLLITQEDGTRAALVVDSIEEQRQVVIKGLQESYGYVPGIAAATILGDGQIALILDPIDLMSNVASRNESLQKLDLSI